MAVQLALVVVVVLAVFILYYGRRRKNVVEPPKKKLHRTHSSSTLLAPISPKESLWDVNLRGFLPSRSPRSRPDDKRLQVLTDLAELLPSAAAVGSFRTSVLNRSDQLFDASRAVKETTSEDELECAFSLYAYCACALAKEGGIIPRCLARGFVTTAERLGRRPMLDYAGCVLYNWELVDPKGPISPENVRMLRRFTGLVDEEWFFKTHLIIEAAASDAVVAVKNGYHLLQKLDDYSDDDDDNNTEGETSPSSSSSSTASSDDDPDSSNSFATTTRELVSVLRRLEECFGNVVRECLPLMFEHVGEHGALCDYYFFYHRLRPFVVSRDLIFEGEYDDKPVSLPGPSGAMSSLLPALDAFLGVANSNDTLKNLLATFSDSMPRAHREFLDQLSRGDNLRDLVMKIRGPAKRSHDVTEALAAQFDRCVDLVLDFRWRHLNMVRKYVVEPSGDTDAAGTGGTSALDYLHEHIADTEAAKLPEQTAKKSFFGFLSLKGDPDATAPESYRPRPTRAQEKDDLGTVWAVDGKTGFLPRGLKKSPPKELRFLEDLAGAIPFACAARGGAFRDLVAKKASAFRDVTVAELAVEDLERVRVLLAFVSAAYARCDAASPANLRKKIAGDAQLPDYLRALMDAVSKRLDRSKRLCLTDLVLCNFLFDSTQDSPPPRRQLSSDTSDPQRRISSSSGGCPVLAGAQPSTTRSSLCPHASRPPSPRHAGTTTTTSQEEKPMMLCRFLAVPEEDALWSLFLAVERQSPGIVAAVGKGSQAGLDCSRIVDALRDVRKALQAAALAHDDDFEQRGSRGDKVTMRRLRPFLLPAGSQNSDLACLLYTGDSLILPTLWKFLGIAKPKAPAAHLQLARDAVLHQRGAPRPHRRFLEDLKSIRPAVLHVCGGGGGGGGGGENKKSHRLPVHSLARLEGAYNGCIDELLRFCSRRSQLVCRYLPTYAADFRDNEFEHDRRAIEASRLNLLLDRRIHRR